MNVRINKIITWNGKEYAHIIEDRPFQFCDFCAFSELCGLVIKGKLEYNKSPMPICNELCEADNTHYAMFIPAEKSKQYIENVKKL